MLCISFEPGACVSFVLHPLDTMASEVLNTQYTTSSTLNPFSLLLTLSVDPRACTVNQRGKTTHTGVSLKVDITLNKWHDPDATFPYLRKPNFTQYDADADTVWNAVTDAVNRAVVRLVHSASYESGEWSSNAQTVQACQGSVTYVGVQTSDFLPRFLTELKAELSPETFGEQMTQKGWKADDDGVAVQSVQNSSLPDRTQLWIKATGLSITADCEPSLKGRLGKMLIGDPKPEDSATA